MTTPSDAAFTADGSEWEVRPRRGAPVPRRVEGVLHLQGEKEWILSGAPGVLDAVGAALPHHSERLGPGTLLLTFGNSVGRLDLPHLGPVEVASGKWGEDAFDRMLSDLMAVAGSLPFSFGMGPLLSMESSAEERERVRYHAFLYLRHILSDTAPRQDRLIPVLELILRDPHRRWRRDFRSVPLEEATRVDPTALAHLAGSPLRRVDRMGDGTGSERRVATAGVRRLALRLGGHLPERIREERVASDVDTLENRFVLHFLREAHALIREVAKDAAGLREAFATRLAREADACGRRLDQILRAPLWREVGEARHLSLTSTVLQGRRGYREVFRHWLTLRQGTRIPLRAEEARRMVEAKDVALLYELWCYFRVVDQVRDLLGAPDRAGVVDVAKWQAHVRPEYRVHWPGVTLAYNGRFSAGRRGARFAYSTPLRPDIVLTHRRRGGTVVHLFDAKFRVDRGSGGSRGGDTFKRTDLAKMHAYRDAIPAARAAWVLYPGEEHRMFHVEPGDEEQGGVGAIPLVPGGREAPLAEVIRGVLGRGRVGGGG